MKSKVIILTFLVTSLVLACSDNGPTAPTAASPSRAPTSPPPVTSVVAEGSTSDLREDFFLSIGFNTTAVGDLEAIVDWTFVNDTLWMYLASGECREQFAQVECPFDPGCECQFLARSETNRPKPRSLSAPGRSPGLHTLEVWNRGPETESISWQALLTTTSAGSSLLSPSTFSHASSLRKASP